MLFCSKKIVYRLKRGVCCSCKTAIATKIVAVVSSVVVETAIVVDKVVVATCVYCSATSAIQNYAQSYEQTSRSGYAVFFV